jgi:hypothetical protein
MCFVVCDIYDQSVKLNLYLKHYVFVTCCDFKKFLCFAFSMVLNILVHYLGPKPKISLFPK